MWVVAVGIHRVVAVGIHRVVAVGIHRVVAEVPTRSTQSTAVSNVDTESKAGVSYCE